MSENKLIHFPKFEESEPLNLLTSNQVRDMFDISKSTLHRWCNEYHILPKLKVGRRIYFKKKDVENMLTDQ